MGTTRLSEVQSQVELQPRTSGSGGLAHGAQLCPHAIGASQDEVEEMRAAIWGLGSFLPCFLLVCGGQIILRTSSDVFIFNLGLRFEGIF